MPLLLEANPYNWALIATHVHGRSGRECQQRWRALMREAATSIPEGEAAAAADADAVAAHEMESGELEASPGAAPPSVWRRRRRSAGAAASGSESAAYDDDVSETASNHSIHAPPLDDDDDDDDNAAADGDAGASQLPAPLAPRAKARRGKERAGRGAAGGQRRALGSRQRQRRGSRGSCSASMRWRNRAAATTARSPSVTRGHTGRRRGSA